MRQNKYDGRCADCGRQVAAGQGVLTGKPRRWKTWCQQCAPAAPSPGSHSGWFDGALAALDFETTGVDAQRDRIISYACVGPASPAHAGGDVLSGLVNPGVPIDASAQAVHGIGPEQVADAPPTGEVIGHLLEWLNTVIAAQTALVVFNAPYDLTMLAAEAARHNRPQPVWDDLLVIDPLVIDWGIYRGELGPRKLSDVCAFYHIDLSQAHDARADAMAARQAAVEMGRRHVEAGAMTLPRLMEQQKIWFAGRAEDWNAYARRVGRSLDDPNGWPVAKPV